MFVLLERNHQTEKQIHTINGLIPWCTFLWFSTSGCRVSKGAACAQSMGIFWVIWSFAQTSMYQTHIASTSYWFTFAMMTSSNGNISVLLAVCAGNSPVTGEFPSQRPVTRSFDVILDLHPNKRLSKQSWGWRFDTPPRTLWRLCNAFFTSYNISHKIRS